MARKQSTIELVQELVERGANAAEEIHKAIADLPLEILADNGVMPEPVKEARRVQDRVIGAVYDVVRRVNRRLGAFATEVAVRISADADAGRERAAA